MECPVCHKYYFAEDTELEKMEPGYEGKQDDYCPSCGWKYSLFQAENPDVPGRENELSLVDYIRDYKEKVAIDPDYDYDEENYCEEPHLCPVCGRYEFPDSGSFDICPYCGWQDDSLMESEPDRWGGNSNPLCLNDYRNEYSKIISENPDYIWNDDK